MQKASVLPFFGPGKNKKDPFSDVLHCMILSFCDGNYDSQPRHKYVRNKLENLFPHNLSPQSGVHIASVFITIPDICHFFYTGKIFGEENLHQNLHSKLPIYTVNCQFFALNLKKFTPGEKNLHGRRPWRP